MDRAVSTNRFKATHPFHELILSGSRIPIDWQRKLSPPSRAGTLSLSCLILALSRLAEVVVASLLEGSWCDSRRSSSPADLKSSIEIFSQ